MGPTWKGTLAVAQFEARRSTSVGRWALWLVMVSFPITIVSIVKVVVPDPGVANQRMAWGLLIFALSQVTSVLGVLLLASPSIQVELENRTWIFSATRPFGRRTLLLGRYLVAVLWSLSASATAITVCCLVARPDPFVSTWMALVALAFLSCAAFASLYSLLAVLFPTRAMSIAFSFTLIFEVLIAFVPAMINQFTIQFRLRCLFVRWLDLGDQMQTNVPLLFNESSSFQHLFVLGLYVVGMLFVAVVMLESKELATADD